MLVAGVDVEIGARVQLAADRVGDHLLHLLGARPDVRQVHVVPGPVLADRLGLEVDVHSPRQRVRDDERG